MPACLFFYTQVSAMLLSLFYISLYNSMNRIVMIMNSY